MKKQNKPKKKPGTKTSNFPVLTVAFAVILALIVLCQQIIRVCEKGKIKTNETALKKNVNLYTLDPVERYIIMKAVDQPVSPGLFPVAIYEVKNGIQSFGASGVCYSNTYTGTWRLITMSHVFFKRDSPTSFFLRKLTPCEAKPSWCIERIVTIGAQWGADNGLAECDIAPLRLPLPIVECTGIQADGLNSQAYTFDEVRSTGQTNISERTVTSLVTKERVELRGVLMKTNNDSWWYLADCTLVPGESGTCFIGDDGSLYFAEGGVTTSWPQEEVEKFKLTVSMPATLSQPLRPRKP